MKLKTLRIHNIASIEDAYIDFDGRELGAQDIFLICGPTGAGKTTILDAICLALFDKTPRIVNSSKQKINEFDDSGQKTELNQTNNVLHLVRKHAVEASVVLTFEVDGRAYTAKWRVYRIGQYRGGKEAKTFTQLTLEEKVSREFKKEWTLTDDTGENVEKHVKEAIEGVIKMTFEQFCKTTMLAQGEFTKFLSSSPDDKAEILEKLVGTERYAQVGAVINRKANDLKRELEVLEKELENIRFLSAEERDEKLKEIEAITAKIANITALQAAIDQKIKWIDDSAKCAQDIANALTRCQEATACLEDENVKAQSQQLALWDTTYDLRSALLTLKQCEDNTHRIDIEHNRLCLTYDEAIAGNSYLLDTINRIKAEIDQLKTSIASQADYQQMFDNANLICSKHSDILRNRDSIDKNTGYIQALTSTYAEGIQQRLDIEAQKCGAEAEIKAIEESVVSHKHSLSELGADTIDNEAEAVNQHKTIVTNAENAIAAYDEAKQTHADKLKRANEALAQIQPLQQIVDIRTKEFDAASRQEQESRELYDKTLASVSNHAKALRHNLNVGDACPVCGHTIEALTSDEVLAEALRPLDDKYRSDEAKAKSVSEALDVAKGKLLEAKTKAKTLAEEAAEAESKINALVVKLQMVCEQLGIGSDADIRPTLDDLRHNDDVRIDSIKARKAKMQQIRNAIDKAEAEIKAIRTKRLLPAEKRLATLNAEIERLSAQKAKLTGEVETCTRSIDTLNAEISRLINPDWKPANSDEYYTELKLAAQMYAEQKRDHDAKTAEVERLNQQLLLIESSMLAIAGLFPDLAERSSTRPRELHALSKVWTDLRATAGVLAKDIEANSKAKADAEMQIEASLTAQPEINIEDVKALLAISVNDIAKMRNTINALREKASNAEAVLTDAKKRADSFAESPLMEDENKESLTTAVAELAQQLTQLSEAKGRLVHELETDELNHQLQGKKKDALDVKRTVYGRWEILNRYLGSTEGKLFRNVAQSFILSELLDKANAYLSNISTRYELFCYPGTFTIMMRDGYQGGVERSTNTLSGGESFIISLSLALGLSSMQNVDFEVDTLFIDEGFGTLSPEYLDPVITALKRLNETYGRRVGIISHVDSLKQRIPASIEVSKQGTSCSRVTVRLT